MKGEEEQKLWNIVPGYDFNEEIDMADASSWFLDEIHRGQTPLKSLVLDQILLQRIQASGRDAKYPHF